MGEDGEFFAEIVKDFAARKTDRKGEASPPLNEDGCAAVFLGDAEVVAVERDGWWRDVGEGFHRMPASQKE